MGYVERCYARGVCMCDSIRFCAGAGLGCCVVVRIVSILGDEEVIEMARRGKLGKRKSKKLFRKGALQVHPRNAMRSVPMRGGIRL